MIPKSGPTRYQRHTSMQTVIDRVVAAASSLYLAVDVARCAVAMRDRTLQLMVHLDTPLPPGCNESMIKSALMVALTDEFDDFESVDLVVSLPSQVNVPPPPAMRATEWIQNQRACVLEWATVCAQTLCKSSYEHVIDAYPWRRKAVMKRILPVLCLRSLTNVANGLPDEVSQGNVDLILPDFDELLSPIQACHVREEVRARLGRPSSSLLELYEVVYDCVTSGKASPWMAFLHAAAFE